MAELGFRTIDEMIGRADCLDVEPAVDHWKAKGLDLAPLLHQPDAAGRRWRGARVREQDHGLDGALDNDLIAGGACRRSSTGRRWSSPRSSATPTAPSARCSATR